MAIGDLWTRILTLRRMVKAVDELVRLQARQTVALERIADRVAPIVTEASPADLKQTSATFTDLGLQGKIQDYTEQVFADTGREPTEEEILRHLEGEDIRL